MKKNTIDRDYLMSVLTYDSATGLMRWKVRKARRIHVGDIAGRPNNTGYLQVGIDGTIYCVHRLAWLMVHGVMPEGDIDHIDRNRSNNVIANLRLVTRSQNIENTLVRRTNRSGFKGAFWHKASRRWHAAIQSKGVKQRLGSFADPEEAYAVYCSAAATFHSCNPVAAHGEVPATVAARGRALG